MSKFCRYLKHSAITRIIILIIALVLPVNVLTLLMSGIIYQKSEQEIYEEIQNGLDRSLHDFEIMVQAANRRLITLDYSDPDFNNLEFPPSSANRIELSSSLFNAKSKLKNARMEYSFADIMFFHFRENSYTIIDGNLGVPIQNIRELVETISEQENSYRNYWECVKLNETPVLFGYNRWNNADFGIMINLNWALDTLNQNGTDENRAVFAVKNDYSILSDSADAFLLQNDLSLQELLASDDYEVLIAESEQYDISFVEAVRKERLLSWIPSSVFVLELIVLLLFVLVIPLLLFCFYSWVIRPVRNLTRAIDRIEAGNLDVYIEEEKNGSEFDQINRNFNSMMKQVRELKIDAYERELQQKNVRMRYLSQQIQPHFILNILNILYSYDESDFYLAQKMILLLSQYFRYIVYAKEEYTELKREFDFVRNYFDIQKIRYPKLLEFTTSCDPSLEQTLLPPLLVQNFAENTIKHALKSGTKITVSLTAEQIPGEDRMIITLSDTGSGISEDIIRKMEQFKKTYTHQEGLGVGFENSVERLHIVYNDNAQLLIHSNDSVSKTVSGTVIELILPIIRKEQTTDESIDS